MFALLSLFNIETRNSNCVKSIEFANFKFVLFVHQNGWFSQKSFQFRQKVFYVLISIIKCLFDVTCGKKKFTIELQLTK